MKHQIISFSGRAGSGKDTAAAFLIQNYGFKKLSFGASLKDAVAVMFGWERKLLDGDTKASREWRESEDAWWTDKLDLGRPVTPRFILQNFGTEVVRDKLHRDFWVLALERQLEKAEQPVVITDTRFFNEMAMLKSKGAVMCGIYRGIPKWLGDFYKGVERIQGNLDRYYGHNGLDKPDFYEVLSRAANQVVLAEQIPADNGEGLLHSSEYTHLLYQGYNHVIDNTGSLAQLHQTVASLVK
jgi:hypothetical protein